jgi:drug/metabolite transporter (DMT)-like permease
MERNKLNAHIAVFAANILFGLNNPISRSLMPDLIDPIALTYFRIIGGATLFWLSALFIKPEKVPLKDIGLLFLAAFFSLTANQIPFFIGLSKTSPIDASIVVTTLPIVSMLLAAIIIKEPITFKKALGVIVGASGALFLILSENADHVGQGNFTGNIIVFCAVISFSLYLNIFKNLIPKYSPFTIMRWMFLFASIQCFPFCQGALSELDFSLLTGTVFWRVAYIVFFASFISYLLLAVGQKMLLPTTLSMYNYVQPIIASLVAVFIGLDAIGYEQIVATVLVFVGVYIVTQSKTRAQLEAERARKSVENTL